MAASSTTARVLRDAARALRGFILEHGKAAIARPFARLQGASVSDAAGVAGAVAQPHARTERAA
jgi:hypothetical protein